MVRRVRTNRFLHRKDAIIKLQEHLREDWLKLLPLREKKEYLEGVRYKAQSKDDYGQAGHVHEQLELSGLDAAEERMQRTRKAMEQKWEQLETRRIMLETMLETRSRVRGRVL